MTLDAQQRAANGIPPLTFADVRDVPGVLCPCGEPWSLHDPAKYQTPLTVGECPRVERGAPYARVEFPDGRTLTLWHPFADTRDKNPKTRQTVSLHVDGSPAWAYTDHVDDARTRYEAAYRQITDEQR